MIGIDAIQLAMICGSWIEKIRVCLNRQSSTEEKSRNHSRQLTASASEKVCLHWYLTGGSCPDKDVSDWTVTAISGVSFLTLGQNMALLTLETCRTDPFQMLPKKGTMSCRHIGFIDVFQLTIGEKDHGLVRLETNTCDHFAMGICYLFSPASFSLGRFLLVQSHPDLEVQNMMTAEFFVLGSKPKEHLKHSTAWPFLE